VKKKLLILAACVTLAIPAVGAATPIRPGGYVSGFLGASVARDAGATTDDFVTGDTFNERVAYDPSIDVGGTAGYDFGMFRLEGELSYKRADIKSITDQADGFQFRAVDGNIGALAMMFNAFFDLHNNTPVTPYLGGGIGFAAMNLSDTFGTDTRVGPPQRTLIYASDSDTVFAYQAGVGLDIALNRQLSLDLGYRYFATDNATFNGDNLTATSLKFESHNATVGLRVRF
jgi:opacity protein-like surface antigen